jgi:hypothetical protein
MTDGDRFEIFPPFTGPLGDSWIPGGRATENTLAIEIHIELLFALI